MCVCVCVWVCVDMERQTDRQRERCTTENLTYNFFHAPVANAIKVKELSVTHIAQSIT